MLVVQVVSWIQFFYRNHKVAFYAVDACNNTEKCTSLFRVVDNNKPTPVCKILAVDLMPLGKESRIELLAEMFNASSYDNCDTVAN